MSGEGEFSFLRMVIIWLFSIAIIFLGVKELHLRNVKRAEQLDRDKMDPRQILVEMRDDIDQLRLVRDPDALKDEVERRAERSPKRESLKSEIQNLVP